MVRLHGFVSHFKSTVLWNGSQIIAYRILYGCSRYDLTTLGILNYLWPTGLDLTIVKHWPSQVFFVAAIFIFQSLFICN